MPRIRCRYDDCVFLDDHYCSAAAIEIDPDTGCSTHTPSESVVIKDDWDDEDDIEEWEEDPEEDLEEDTWDDEDDDEFYDLLLN